MKHKDNIKAAVKNVGWQIKAKIVLALAVPAILIALVVMMSLPEESIDFNFTENMGMWQLSHGSKFRQVGNSLELIKGQGDLYLIIPQMNIDADYYDVCVLEGSWPIAYDHGRLMFISPFNKQFNFNFRYDFDTGRAGKNNKQYLDLQSHGAWQGIVKAVLILPATNAQQVFLKSVRFIHANPWTKARAWWSAFTRYSDPLLGTCFAMATPILIGKPFNHFFVPLFWFLLVICGVIVLGVCLLKADRRISNAVIVLFMVVFIFAWGLLDLRNNVYYLKAISRNISLYWGKPMQEKRGIVVGDPEFIDFMKFCDDHIPIQARIYSQIPDELPGTPASYLSRVQYWANQRPRFNEGSAQSYFVFYKPQWTDWQVCQEQASVNEQLKIDPGEYVLQELSLWRPARYLTQINLWLEQGNVEVALLGADQKSVVGLAEYVSQADKEAIFRFFPRADIEARFLQIKNKGKTPITIGTVYGNQYYEGCLKQAGKDLYSDLTFRLIYDPKGLKLFKRFKADAYILTEQEQK